jgi:hypothetical protein
MGDSNQERKKDSRESMSQGQNLWTTRKGGGGTFRVVRRKKEKRYHFRTYVLVCQEVFATFTKNSVV